jgi:prolyl oligopeptidase
VARDNHRPGDVSWIKAENNLTDSYLAAVPARESIREQLTGLWDYPRAGVPFERGGGSDWLTWRVRDVATGEDLADAVEWSKFSGAAWRSDRSGFFYGAMQPTSAGAEYLEANAPSKILFHRIGTPQDADEVVFAAPDEPDWMPYAEVTEDGRFLVVTIERAAGFETQLHVLDLKDPAAQPRPLIGDFESVNVVVTSVGTTFTW